MGSIPPFQDPNFNPYSTISGSGSGASSSKPPVLHRPKMEPYDELLPQPSFFARTVDWGLNSTPSAPPTVIILDPDSIPSSPQTPLPDSVDSDLDEALALLADPLPQDGNVYAEFARVSEMLRSVLGKSSNNYQGTESWSLDAETGAIVPVPAESADKNLVPNYKRQKRSKELVRVTGMSQEDYTFYRDLVRRTRMLYDSIRIFHMFSEEKRVGIGGGKKSRGDLRASTLMRQNGLWLNREKRIVGAVPGVFVGDLFLFRMELCVVGLHGQVQAGIDYLPSSESPNGEPIATSVIVSGGYEDDDDQGDMVVYTGHGGRDKNGKFCCDQKLEGGNLALEKSMVHGIEIRVMRGLSCNGLTTRVYVYDGLYKIVESWFEIGKSGFGVYRFRLLRIEGQPEMGSTKWMVAETLRVKPLELRPKGYMTLDLSGKKESVPIFMFNDIDSEYDPMCYEYLPRTVFPHFVHHASGNTAGCNCVTGCTDSCLCGKKNGGEIPFDQFGFLLRGKPLIFECGPNCSCPPSCRNRVSQKRLRHRLEVFRSAETGWGVRTLDLIYAGSFICEYAGVILTRDQAEICSMGGDSLIYPGRFAPRWKEWGDMSKVFPEYVQPTEPSLPPLDFAMDVSTLRNVACYMTHSICPNVMVQFVLYDHSNMMFPHMMLFAMENIAPMQELSIDYGVPDEYTGKLAICHN